MAARTTRFVFASLTALILAVVLPVSASAATTVVDETGEGGWVGGTAQPTTYSTSGVNSYFNFTSGPQPAPGGSGSLELKAGSSSVIGAGTNEIAFIRNSDYDGVALSDLEKIEFSTYVATSPNGQQVPYLNLYVDADNDGTQDTRLWFEPPFQSLTSGGASCGNQADDATGVWQTWTAYDSSVPNTGCWYASPGGFAGTGTNTQPLANFIAANPSAVIRNQAVPQTNGTGAIRLAYGGSSPAHNADGYVDNFKIQVSGNEDVYDFERPTTRHVDDDNGGFDVTGCGGEQNPCATINYAIGQALAGDTIDVAAGTYNEDVTVNKANLTLQGAGADSTTISGLAGGGSATVAVTAAGVTIDGFTITRDQTVFTDPALNSAGLSINAAGANATISNNKFVANRSGIDINNSGGHTLTGNLIHRNRTGMIFRNQTDNLTVTGNKITENYTLGVLFLDASGGSNVPLQQAHDSHFNGNQISDNWYGEVVDRQTGGSLPAPGTTNTKDFTANWFGTASPVVTTNNSNEAAHPSVHPSYYGGPDNPPAGEPDIAGAASANILIDDAAEEGDGDYVAPGGSVSTDPPTGSGEIGATVTSPNAGVVLVQERPMTAEEETNFPPPSGYAFLDQHVYISAPDADATDPLVLTFEVYAPSVPASELNIFRDGVEVDDCIDTPPTAIDPDPCVFDRQKTGNVISISVYTTQASLWSFAVDNVAPVLSLTTPADGLVTSDNSPQFAGTGGTDAGDLDPITIRIFDGTPPAGAPDYIVTATRGLGGAYSTSGPYTRTSDSAVVATLPDGQYSAQAMQEDNVGNTGFAPEEPSFFIDTTAPTVTFTSGPDFADQPNNSVIGDVSSDANFTWTVFDAGPTPPTVTCRLTKTVNAPDPQTHGFQACNGGAKSYLGLSDGTYRFQVRATDAANNITTATYFFVVDAADPTVNLTVAPDLGGSGDIESNDNTPNFDWTASDPSPSSNDALPTNAPASQPLDVTCELTGPEAQPEAPCSAPLEYGTLGDPIEDGEYTFTLRVTDAAGNQTVVTHSFLIDSVNPSLAIINPKPANGNSTSATLNWRHSDQSDIDSPSSGVEIVECKLANSSDPTPVFQPCGTPNNDGTVTDDSKSYTNLPGGTQTFTVRVVDGAGNEQQDSYSWHIDAQAPDTTIDTGAPGTPTQPWDNSKNATFTFNGSDPAPDASSPPFDFQCRLDAGAWTLCGDDIPNPGTQSYTNLSDGPHTFRVRAIDQAGNVDPTPAVFNWSIDTVKPDVTVVFPKQDGRYSMFKDENLDADYNCFDAGSGLVAPPDDCKGSVIGHGLVADGDPIYNDAEGTYTFRVRAEDQAGNVTTVNVTYHVFTFENLINDDDPIAYYRMNEPSSSSLMEDFSGNGKDGEYKNAQMSGPVGISGDGDRARRFFGESGYGYVNGLERPRFEFTMSAFVRFDEVRNQTIMEHGGRGVIYVNNTKFAFRSSTSDPDGEVRGGPKLVKNKWYHVVGVFDGGTNHLYVNGVKVKENESTSATNKPGEGGASTFYVGYGQTAPWLKGSLDEVAYFDHALSDEHIYEIFLADPPPAEEAQVPSGGGGGDAGGGGGGGGGGDTGGGDTGGDTDEDLGDDELIEDDEPSQEEESTDDDSGDDEGDDDSGDEEDVDEEEEVDLSGTWVRKDKSVLDVVAKGKGWLGTTVLTANDARKSARSKKAKASKKKAKVCGLPEGDTSLVLKADGDGFVGQVRDAVKTKKGKCKARKSDVTAELNAKGNKLELTRANGKTETLTRSRG